MTINDRLTQGFLSGLLAGIILNVVDYISFLLNIVEITYLDWAGTITFGYRPQIWTEYILSMVVQLLFTGFLGIIFGYLVTMISSRNILLKGLLFALGIWFLTYAVAAVFELPGLVSVRADTVISDIITVSLFGLCLAYFFKRFVRNTKL